MRPKQRAVAVALEWRTWAETPNEMLPSGKTLAELVTKAIRQAVAEEREACATVADNDPELPGPMPDKTWALTREHATLSLRAAVRVTKTSIAKAIRARGGA